MTMKKLRYQEINTASKDFTTYRLSNVHEKSQGLKKKIRKQTLHSVSLLKNN